MKVIRRIGGVVLWVVAVLGALSGALFIAHALGWVQPLVVVSGSMEPDIRKGDLLIAIPVAATELDVGEVASLHSDVTGRLVTHRVIDVSRDGSDVVIEMEGDANGVPDSAPYRLDADASVWQPIATVPAVGDLMLILARPTVAIPLAVSVLALIGLSLVPPRTPARHLAPRPTSVRLRSREQTG
jgi:signal peptidase